MTDAESKALVAKALACWKAADSADSKQLAREKEDMGFYAGGDMQWSAAAITARAGAPADPENHLPAVPARPMLSINKCRAPVRQLLNQERNAHMGAELVPADDFGVGVPEDVKAEIELREGLYRRMQRQPEAKAATSWTFDRVAQAGRGFWRLNIRYVSDRSFDQEIVRERIYNQSSVRLDPSHVEPDGSDARWAMIAVDMSEEGYKAEFPDSKVSDAIGADDFTGLMSQSDGWFTDVDGQKRIRVVEYFYTDYEKKTLCWFNGPVWSEQLPKGAPKVGPPDATGQSTKPRVVSVPQIKWAKLNGAEVLDSADWAGKWIPFVKELGEELQPFDDDRRSEGLVRPAISSQQGFNFMASELVFAIGQATKAPLMATREQIEGYEGMYERSAVMPMPYLLYNAVNEAGQFLPPPQPTDRDVPIQHIAFGLNTFAQGIHDTTGVPEASLGNVDPSIKSGRAILALQQQAQASTSNYMDNHARAIMHDARIWNDLAFSVYMNRPGRLEEIVNGQNETETRAIGGPNSSDPSIKHAKLTDRNFNIVVKTGKNFDTRNEEGSASLVEALSGNPALFAAYLDLYFGMQTWPGADIAKERAKLMLPPNIQQAEAEKNQDPKATLQLVKGQAEQQGKLIEALTARVKEMQIAAETDTVKQAGETERLRLELGSKERIAAIQAKETAMQTMAKLDSAAAIEMIRQEAARVLAGMEDRHEILMGQLGHQQATEQAEGDQGRALESGAVSHAQNLEAGEVSHGQNLEAQQQAAELAPEPASGE